MNPPAFPFLDPLLGALGSGVLQGLALTLVAVLALRMARRANAATRHALLFGTLLLVAGLPLAHALVGPIRSATFATATRSEGATDFVETPAPPSLEASETLPPSIPVEMLRDGTEDASADAPAEPDWIASPDEVPDVTDLAAPETNPAESTPARNRTEWNLRLPAGVAIGLFATWGVIAAIRLARLAWQVLLLHRMKRAGEAAPEELARAVEELRSALGIRRPVTLRVCPALGTPVAVGYFRPAVLLPAPAVLDATIPTEEWRRILRHELAHLRRGDDWTNLIQQITVALFFFHPGILWLSRRLTLEREVACDDHVLAARVPRRDYALFLTEFARRTRNQSWSAAPAAWSHPSQLRERIHMLLDTHRNTSPGIARGRTGAGIAALTVAAVAALLAAPRLSFASAEPGEAALTASASEDVVTTISVTSADETEPKEKPDLHPAPASAPVAVIVAPPPTPPVPPIAAVPPVPGAPIALPAPAPHPAPMPHAITILPGGAGYGGHPTILQAYPTPPVPTAPGDDEFSRRLERLEKLVESLVAPEAKRGPGRAPTKPRGPGPEAPRSEFNSDSRRPSPDKPESARVEVEVRRTEGAPAEAHFQALSRVLEQAARQIESAARQAEVAAKEAEKSSHQRIESLVLADSTRAREQHRKVLDEQRHVLQKQIAEMEAQLGRLEAQFDRVEAQLDREADLAENARDRADVNHQVEKALHDANLARDTEWKERKQLEKELEKAKMKTKAKDDVKEPVDDRATLPPPLPPQR